MQMAMSTSACRGKAGYVVAVQHGDHKEILYDEHLTPGVDYVYQPDSQNPSGRVDALIAEQV